MANDRTHHSNAVPERTRAPATARAYLRFLAELMEVPIAIVSLGAQRDQTIVVEDPIHGPKRALLSA
jgi:adenylosuccinate synthase